LLGVKGLLEGSNSVYSELEAFQKNLLGST